MIAVTVSTVFSAVAIRNLGHKSSNQLLLLLCETGEKNIEAYFESIEQSVETVSGYAADDLSHTGTDQLAGHIERVKDIFEKTAKNTSGILTYYYRIDPAVSEMEKGFWFVDLTGDGFVEHEVTDITLYDTEDQSKLVWFTVPKATGRPIWLPPYFTENLDVYVLSYNVPIYKDRRFIGVIGIELDYKTLVEQVDNITLYKNGYAFINDENGNIIYHPRIDTADIIGGKQPNVPDGLLSESNYIRYNYDGIEKQAVWKRLTNGMRLNVTVPSAEINTDWHRLVIEIIILSLILLIIFIFISMRFAGHIAKPLKELTLAAEQINMGNYDFKPQYDGKDEVGILTRTFSHLVTYLKLYISDLGSLAYADPLTSVRNKGAFTIYIRELQGRIDYSDEQPEFAICVFDCNELKMINDSYGHDKGDIYLQRTSKLICRAFQHSPVFRIGGDEFAVILQNAEYKNRAELARRFEKKCKELTSSNIAIWEQISVAMGMAEYDPVIDKTVDDVIRRADKRMYKNKRIQKSAPPEMNARKKIQNN